jgi:hypothetical protein
MCVDQRSTFWRQGVHAFVSQRGNVAAKRADLIRPALRLFPG